MTVLTDLFSPLTGAGPQFGSGQSDAGDSDPAGVRQEVSQRAETPGHTPEDSVSAADAGQLTNTVKHTNISLGHGG